MFVFDTQNTVYRIASTTLKLLACGHANLNQTIRQVGSASVHAGLCLLLCRPSQRPHQAPGPTGLLSRSQERATLGLGLGGRLERGAINNFSTFTCLRGAASDLAMAGNWALPRLPPMCSFVWLWDLVGATAQGGLLLLPSSPCASTVARPPRHHCARHCSGLTGGASLRHRA